MKRVTIADIESDSGEIGIDRRRLSGPLNTTDVAINHYRLAPGTGFPGGLHSHMDQEEVFVVIKGEATFETLASGSDTGETVTVGAGEAIRFAPGGEFHSGANESDGDLLAVAIGAPPDSEDVRIPLECPECSHDDMRVRMDEEGVTFVCPDCDTECVPRACLECGREEMRFALAEENQAVVVCPNCSAEFDRPPLRDR
ncbi:cupin [Halobacteriales archaeon QS_3_64_16]|nr:MAG: cupin [Halobacteriales archaeon QS_3_64_16]